MNKSKAISLFLILPFVLAAIWALRAVAQGAPGGTITAVDAKTGVVTGKVNSTGQVFTFALANKALVNGVHPGQGVFVNLGKKQVSLDGKSASGTILALLPIVKRPGGSSGQTGSSSSSGSGSSGNSAGSSTSGNTNPQPISFSCGGSTNPLTADTCGKSGGVATSAGTVSCGSSITITGNTFPAGSSDWLTFTVPASRASCANPVIEVRISPVGGSVFDVLTSAAGGGVFNSYDTSSPSSIGVPVIAGLGSAPSPLQPGQYYIRIYGVSSSTTGTWTLTLKG